MTKKIIVYFIAIGVVSCNFFVSEKERNESPNCNHCFTCGAELPELDSTDDKNLSNNDNEDSATKTSSQYDSFFLCLLKKAFAIAQKLKKEEKFNAYFYSVPPDGSMSYSTSVSYNNSFTENTKEFEKKLLQIIIINPEVKSYHYFKLENDSFKYVFKYDCDRIVSSDTLMDINGDNYKDLVIHLRQMGGCCRGDLVEGFMYVPATGRFNEGFGFMNPTFYPKEGVVRGVEYGHRGETSLYKQKWNGKDWETVEHICLDYSNPKQFIKTQEAKFRPTAKDGEVLKKLPKEYLTVEGLDVALGDELERVLKAYNMLNTYPNIKAILKSQEKMVKLNNESKKKINNVYSRNRDDSF